MVAINEVTKKQVASIDLRKADRVVDTNALSDSPGGGGGGSPTSRMTSRPRASDEVFAVRPRSFSVEFGDGEAIVFSTDKEEEKVEW